MTDGQKTEEVSPLPTSCARNNTNSMPVVFQREESFPHLNIPHTRGTAHKSCKTPNPSSSCLPSVWLYVTGWDFLETIPWQTAKFPQLSHFHNNQKAIAGQLFFFFLVEGRQRCQKYDLNQPKYANSSDDGWTCKNMSIVTFVFVATTFLKSIQNIFS